MKPKKINKSRNILSDKIVDAITVKPRPDIEDDHVFGTKPKTTSRVDFSSSGSDDEEYISDFRKRNVNLLSEISKKYEGEVISRNELKHNSDDNSLDKNDKLSSNAESDEDVRESDATDSSAESDDYTITKLKGDISNNERHKASDEDDGNDSDEEDYNDSGDDDDGYDISQQEAPVLEKFEHMKKENVAQEVKKGACVRNQLLLWENLLETRIHLQRCVNTANQMPMHDMYENLKHINSNEFTKHCNVAKTTVAGILDK